MRFSLSKGVAQAHMKRSVIQAILKMGAKSLFLTTLIGAGIGLIGYLKQWDSSLAYSNAFFVAGCLVFVAGGVSRLAAGQEWEQFRRLYAESLRDMSASERANFIVNASASISTVVLGLLTGILLIIISALVLKLFQPGR
jgi:hypothetical protein